MNELNYASLEASKKLFEAGIVLETEWQWEPRGFGTYRPRLTVDRGGDEIPMPCIEEVLREFPIDEDHYIAFYVHGVSWVTLHDETFFSKASSGRYIDALIDLLIWFRKEADHE